MEDNHEQFRNLAEAKGRADNSGHEQILSPAVERIARFLWWIVGGIGLGIILSTAWVMGVNSHLSYHDSQLASHEKTMARIDASESAYERSFEARNSADDGRNSTQDIMIAAIQKTLNEGQPSMVDKVSEMWFMKQHHITNNEPEPSPRK